LRRELLEDSISKVDNLSKKLAKQVKVQHFVVLEDATIESSVLLLGFESRTLFNKINELGTCLNQQAEIIDEWRESLITLLGKPLVDKDADPDGEEYGESLDAQEYAFTYIEVLQQVLSDRAEAVNGVSDPVVEGVQRSIDLKSEYQLELEAERKKMKPIQVAFVGEATFEFSLKGYLQSLKRISANLPFTASRGRAQAEQQLLAGLAQKVQKIHDTQRSELRKLNRELTFFRDLYNSRVEYYRQLQELSDNVAEIDIGKQTVEAATSKRMAEERALTTVISQQIGRKRYLDLLNLDQEPQESDRTCIICQTSFYIGSLTNCGHQFCRECLQEWWNLHKNCPLCKKKLSQEDVYIFTYRAKDATALDLSPAWLSDESNESVVRNGIYAAPSKKLLKEILQFDLEQKYGSKIDFMLRHLKWLLSKDPEVQIVIFSQWSEMLKLIAMALTNQKIRYATMQNGVDEFRQNSAITCFLLHAKNES
jgi:E3 ubiquitin-protein ligase SHPRH